MGASKKKQILNKHVSNYVRAVFADLLESEGFINYEGRDISWFRTKNDELVNTIIFNTRWNAYPIFLDAYCGSYPLFGEISLFRSAYSDLAIADPERNRWVKIREVNARAMIYSEDANVLCTAEGEYGACNLKDAIHSRLDSINSISESYEVHKKWRIEATPKEYKEFTFRNLSSVFIDEAIYLDDKELLPHCIRAVNELGVFFECAIIEYPKRKECYARMLEENQLRQHALLDGARNEYLEILEQRKQKNMAMLKKLSK